METKNIKLLEKIEAYRWENKGYLKEKENVHIRIKNSNDVTIVKQFSTDYSLFGFDEYVVKAILEKESELLQRAFELEEIEYERIKKLAKIEAANILAGEQLI